MKKTIAARAAGAALLATVFGTQAQAGQMFDLGASQVTHAGNTCQWLERNTQTRVSVEPAHRRTVIRHAYRAAVIVADNGAVTTLNPAMPGDQVLEAEKPGFRGLALQVKALCAATGFNPAPVRPR